MARQDQSRPAPPDLAARLHSAAIHLLRRLRAEDAAAGLSGSQVSALSVLVFGGPLALGDLARAEQVKPPTMSRLVAGLAARGLVESSADAADRRVQRVRATVRGRTLLESARVRRVRRLAAELERLEPAAYRTLADALESLEAVANPDAGPRG